MSAPSFATHFRIADLQSLPMPDLVARARNEGIRALPQERPELIQLLLQQLARREQYGWAEGILDIRPEGFGFLRSPAHGLRPGADDIYVAPSQIDRMQLRGGEMLEGPTRPPRTGGNSFFAMARIEQVDRLPLRDHQGRVPFRSRTPLLPNRRMQLDTSLDGRLLDFWTPLAFGHRILVHSPRNGRRLDFLAALTAVMRQQHAELEVLALVVGESEAEAAALCPDPNLGRVLVAHTGLGDPEARAGELATFLLRRAQRLVECGKDVVFFVDSLTELARADNVALPHSGKLIAPGLDAVALRRSRSLLGSAVQCEEGGSLTMICTLMDDLRSELDQAVGREFAGRAGVEITLTNEPPPAGLSCCVDPNRSILRREENLLDRDAQLRLTAVRSRIRSMAPLEALEEVLASVG